jgi:superfamily II DNA or RNA helicase
VFDRHLRADNDFFLGLYPLLPDSTCWWLAADFDGRGAMADAHAYVRAAASLDMPCALEVSQSGNGAHVWTFFTEPVPASDARAMGTSCIHRAMGLRGSMRLSAYDRLFPSQDVVPDSRASVGNLIAAPLNGGRWAKRRTTTFLDLATWEPFDDQWEFLSGLAHMTPAEVAKAAGRERVEVGVEVRKVKPSPATTVRTMPSAQISAVLDSGLIIQEERLPQEFSKALRLMATIRNPAFSKAQRSRRSTWNIPRFIQGFDVAVNGDLALPRGLRFRAADLIAQAGSHLVVEDARNRGSEVRMPFSGQLYPRQRTAVDAMLAFEDGILQAPTGSGKTVMACAIIAERGVTTLILIDRATLASQWREQVQSLLGVKAGQLGGGRRKLRGTVDVVFLQSLAQRPSDEVRELTSGYGQVVVDECHHVAAASYQHVISKIEAGRWLGLTATPNREDGLEEVTSWELGPIRHVVRDVLPSQTTLVRPYDGPARLVSVHETTFQAPPDLDLAAPGAVTKLDGLVAVNEERNRQIAADVVEAINEGRKCLVLTRRRCHLDALAALLTKVDPLIMRGGTGRKEQAAVRARIADAGSHEPLLVMSTIQYAGEGFDAPPLDTVFLVGTVASTTRVTQAVGRALRSYPGKTEVQVHDYADSAVPLLRRQATKRQRVYRHLGFTAVRRP